jgi:hypothetical protein
MRSSARPIVFLSGFGLGNEWIGITQVVMRFRRSRDSLASPVLLAA